MSRGMSRDVFPSGSLSDPERGYKSAGKSLERG